MERQVKKVYEVVVTNQEVINYLERLSFETSRTQELLETVSKDTDGLFNTDYYSWLYKQYMDVAYEFEMAKQEFARNNLGNVTEHEVDWNLDFATGKVTITQYCDCDINLPQ